MSLLRKALMPLANRFVAGESIDDAVAHVEDLNQDGVRGLVDLLGEHVEDPEAVEAAADEYMAVLERFDAEGVDADLSVKPTHLGLDISYDYCRDTLDDLVSEAARRDRFVWIDMESSDYTEDTIDLYTDLVAEHDNVGVCIQSYLKRSEDDVKALVEEGGVIRLVKGAYDEDPSVAYRDKTAVDENFRDLAEILFQEADDFAIATHDKDLVDHAQELEAAYDREGDFRFQFLMGVRDDLQTDLTEDGYTVEEYVPYGDKWLEYYYRRVMERKENARFAAEAYIRSILP